MTENQSAESKPTSFSRLLPWLVLFLASLGLFYLVEKGCGGAARTPESKTETGFSE